MNSLKSVILDNYKMKVGEPLQRQSADWSILRQYIFGAENESTNLKSIQPFRKSITATKNSVLYRVIRKNHNQISILLIHG